MQPVAFVKTVMFVCCFADLLLSPSGSYAQSSEASAHERVDNGVAISQLIATVAKKSGKKFVVDPRVRGDAVLIGQDPTDIRYNDLLTILQVNGFTAVESGGYVQVIPDASVRQSPLALVTGKETRPDAEFVSKVITVKSISAAQLVPILRPLLPQVAQLAALPCVNKLIMVDTFANVRRIEALIEALDVGEPYKAEKCEPRAQENAK